MAYAQPYGATIPVAHADEDTRAQFITRVYQHIVLAVGAFVAFEAVLFVTGIAAVMRDFFFGGAGFAWIGLLLAVGLASTLASQAAHRASSRGTQYFGLFGEAGLQAIIFAPFLSFVFATDGGSSTVLWSAVVTVIGFGILNLVAYTSRRDFSFLRPFLMWGGIAALVLIGVSVLFGFQLGILFSIVMVAFAGGLILYQTQQVLHRYPADAYVGAAVSLFAALMLLFWYVLRIFMELRN